MNKNFCKKLSFAQTVKVENEGKRQIRLFDENGKYVKNISPEEYENLDIDIRERLTETRSPKFNVIAKELVTGNRITCSSDLKLDFNTMDLLENKEKILYSCLESTEKPKIIPRGARQVTKQEKGKKLKEGQFEIKTSSFLTVPGDIICGETDIGKTKFKYWFICSEPLKRLIDYVTDRTHKQEQYSIKKILSGSSTWATSTHKKYNEYVDICRKELGDIVKRNITTSKNWATSTDEEYIESSIKKAENCKTIAEMNKLIFETYYEPISETIFKEEDIPISINRNPNEYIEKCKKQFPTIMTKIITDHFGEESEKRKKFTNETFKEKLLDKVESCETVSDLNKLIFDTFSDPPYFENYLCPFYTLRYEESSKHYPFLIAALMIKYAHGKDVFEMTPNGEYVYMIKTYNKPIGWKKLPSWV